MAPATTVETVVEGQTHKLWEAPAMHAAGWHDTSAPLGEAGNTVLSGHNTMYGEVFRDLYQLGEGDLVAVYAGGHGYDFVVSSILILPEGDQPRIRRAASSSEGRAPGRGILPGRVH